MYPGGEPALCRDLMQTYGGLSHAEYERLSDSEIAVLLKWEWWKPEEPKKAYTKPASVKEVFIHCAKIGRGMTDEQAEAYWLENQAERKRLQHRADNSKKRAELPPAARKAAADRKRDSRGRVRS